MFLFDSTIFIFCIFYFLKLFLLFCEILYFIPKDGSKYMLKIDNKSTIWISNMLKVSSKAKRACPRGLSYCCLSSGIYQLGPDEKKQGQVIKIMKTQLKCKDGLRTTFSSSYYLQITYLTHPIIKHYLKIWLNGAGKKNREVIGQHSPSIFCKGKSKKHITTIAVRLIVRFVS